jgi:two-component system OmpR family response regulator
VIEPNKIQVDDLVIDRLARRAWRGKRELVLTTKTFDLLVAFALQPDHVVTRESIGEMVWRNARTKHGLIDRHIFILRKTLNGPGEAPMIETVLGMGHRLRSVR